MPVTNRSGPWSKTKDALAHPYLAACDQTGCQHYTAHSTAEEAQGILDWHYCPYPANLGQVIKDMAQGMTQFQKMFTELDSLMVRLTIAKEQAQEVVDHGPSHTFELEIADLRGQMRGLAFAVVCVMDPIFKSPNDVSREVAKRYKLINAGEPTATPGVDYKWNPLDGNGERIPAHIPDAPKISSQPVTAPSRPAVPQETIERIQKAKASGVFGNAELASMYNVSETYVAGL